MDVRMSMKMNSTSSNRVIPAAFLLAPLGLLFGCGTPAAPPLGLSLVRIPEQVFADPPDNVSTPERVELGRLLFFDPILSENGKIACASCHHPDKAMSDGLPVSAALADPKGGFLTRASPSIFDTRYQFAQFWDGRVATLENQALLPIENPREMGSTIPKAMARVSAVAEYRDRFAAAYGELTESSMQRAIAAFGRSLTANSAPVDRFLAGDSAALSSAATAGFNLYYGKARCSFCHYVPLFNGVEGPEFASSRFRVTGVPERGLNELTRDIGRQEFTLDPRDRHAFKTPTLRNVAETAPYMHNGAFDTLEQVIDFYNQGAGAGQAYTVDNIDSRLRSGPLGLTAEEKVQLLAFLREGLTDSSRRPQVPARVPSGLPVGSLAK